MSRRVDLFFTRSSDFFCSLYGIYDIPRRDMGPVLAKTFFFSPYYLLCPGDGDGNNLHALFGGHMKDCIWWSDLWLDMAVPRFKFSFRNASVYL